MNTPVMKATTVWSTFFVASAWRKRGKLSSRGGLCNPGKLHHPATERLATVGFFVRLSGLTGAQPGAVLI